MRIAVASLKSALCSTSLFVTRQRCDRIRLDTKTAFLMRCEKAVMEPKKEHSEHEENGYRETRETYDDPDTNTHIEEVKIERIEDDPRKEDPSRREAQLQNFVW
jgi:hypothetical protein